MRFSWLSGLDQSVFGSCVIKTSQLCNQPSLISRSWALWSCCLSWWSLGQSRCRGRHGLGLLHLLTHHCCCWVIICGAQPNTASHSTVAVDRTAVLEALVKTVVAAEPSSEICELSKVIVIEKCVSTVLARFYVRLVAIVFWWPIRTRYFSFF